MAPLERLSFDDVEILRLGSPVIAGHTMKLLLLEPGPEPLGIDELRERVAGRLAREPRARQRVAFTPLRLGPPAWVDDVHFDLALHVRRSEGTEGISEDGLRATAGETMAERLDPSRPLWGLDLVGPLVGGRIAILARIHHAMADGISALRFLSALLWDGGDDDAASSPAWEAKAPGGPALAVDALRRRAAEAPSRIAALADAALKPARWAGGARAVAALPGTLRRELAPGRADSQLDRPIGGDREVAFATASLDALKEVGHSRPGHVTVNDVLLAGVAGALGEWLEDGSGAAGLRAQVPVSLHHRGERADELGNRDSFLNVDLPLAESDPLRRLELVTSETAERKGRGDAAELYDLFHALSRLRPLYRAASRLASGPREFGLAISNVPGPPDPVRIAGRRMERLATVAEPAPHHALRVSAISSAGELAVGFCSDPGAVSGLDRLAEAFTASLAELRDAAG